MKTKINKILGIAIAVVTIASLFVIAVPASAAAPLTPPQTWNTFPIPSTTGMVLDGTISVGGPIAQAIDASLNTSGIGTLYAYVYDSALTPVAEIVKSVDGGRTWAVSGGTGQPTAAVVEIVCSPTEGNVVFYATASTLFWSQDYGATFTALVSVPTTDAITAFDVMKWQGRYIATVGVDSTLSTATLTSGVYSWDQNDVYNNLLSVGTTTFCNGVAKKVLAVRMAPTFPTDRAVIAMGVAAGVATVRMDINGGAWAAIVADVAVPGTAVTAGDIQCPSDFNAITSPIYFICTSDASAGGIFRINGNVVSANLDTASSPTRNWNNMSISGTFVSGTATILVGGATGKVYKSTNSGSTFSSVSLRSTATSTAWVLLDRAYGTTAAGGKYAYVLNVGGGLGAFNVSVDSASTFNQWSMVNESATGISTINAIDDLAIGSNDDMYMVTRNTDGVAAIAFVSGGIVTITAGTVSTVSTAAVAQSTVTISSTDAETATVTVTNGGITYSGTSGTNWTRVGNIITFTGAGSIIVYPTVNNTQFTIVSTGTTPSNVTVASTTGVNIITGLPATTASVQETNFGSAEVDTLSTNTVVTGIPTTGVTVTPAAIWSQSAGTITFATAGQVATITNTSTSALGVTTLTATYTTGGGANPAGIVPSTANGTGGVWAATGAWGASGTTRNITSLTGQTTAAASTNTSKLWRKIAGGPWERVAVGIASDAQRVIIRVDANYATDKAVFYTIKGSNAAIMVSTNNANSFSAMSSAPGTTVGGANSVYSFLPISSSLVVVGDATGTIVANTTAYWWTETASAPFGAGYTVWDIRSAGGTNVLAVATSGTTLKVAKSLDNGQTWTLVQIPGTTDGISPATLTVTSGSTASIAAANDYATSGTIVVSAVNGVWRYPSTVAAATTNGWLRVDAGANTVTNTTSSINGTVYMPGLVTTAGGPGSVTEGTGMVYAVDSSSASGKAVRDRGQETTAELLDSTVTSRPSVPFVGLWVYPSTSGNVLITIDGTTNTPKLYTYNDTLAVSGTGVVMSLVTSSTATVTFNTLANATGYLVFVNPIQQTSVYTAANGTGIVTTPVTISADLTKGSVPVTGLSPITKYYVSIWATLTTTTPANVMTSFMFGAPAGPSFTTMLTTPVLHTPANGQQFNQSKLNFSWGTVSDIYSAGVPGATSYELWLDTNINFSTAQKVIITTIGSNGLVVSDWAPTGALTADTVYYWQVRALSATANSNWSTVWSFTVAPATVPPVTVTANTVVLTQAPASPVPTIIITQGPVVTITQAAPVPTPVYTLPQQTIVLQQPQVSTPTYIWIIVGVGALLTLAVIILIIRTRRVV